MNDKKAEPSPQDAYLGRLEKQISTARLTPYMKASNGSVATALARYYWNIELCQAYYPALHTLEVSLRNTLDRVLGPQYPVTGWKHISSWLDRVPAVITKPEMLNIVRQAKATLFKTDANGDFVPDGRIGHGHLVAALPFGFWVALLGSAYDDPGYAGTKFWPANAKDVFPSAGKSTMTEIRAPFTQIRHFRNRVFHHEPVWPKYPDQPTPKQRYDEILKVLRWIGPPQSEMASQLHQIPQEIFDEATAVPAMENRLLATIDKVLERARLKKENAVPRAETTKEDPIVEARAKSEETD